MALVHRQWSGKHQHVVCGIGLVSLLWTDGDRHVPLDWRIYDKPNDQASKNDHFSAMSQAAKARGFAPAYVAFDSWYGSLANLKQVRACGWTWLTQLKANRLVDPGRSGNSSCRRARSERQRLPRASQGLWPGQGLQD